MSHLDYTFRVSSKHLFKAIQTRFPFPKEWLPPPWIMARRRLYHGDAS
jgi:hypothetical protein